MTGPRSDLERIKEILDPDVVWHEPGSSSIHGDYRGVDAVLGFFGSLFAATDGSFRAEALDVLAADDRVVVLQHSTGTRNGRELDMTHPVVWELRDGKPIEATNDAYDIGEHDEFWG